MREIIFDTETTGFDPLTGDRMVEIGCIEMVGRIMTGESYHAYFNPQRPMPAAAEQVHGLSDRFLSDKPLFAHKAEELLRVKHGALLDAELLAQLYIELTGGRQIGLGLVDDGSAGRDSPGGGTRDLVRTRLFREPRPHNASPEELARHSEFIAKIKDALWLESESAL
jgi:DNA polymerase-3 subunit epsilon